MMGLNYMNCFTHLRWDLVVIEQTSSVEVDSIERWQYTRGGRGSCIAYVTLDEGVVPERLEKPWFNPEVPCVEHGTLRALDEEPGADRST